MTTIGADRPSGKGRFLVGDLESKGLLDSVWKQEDFHVIVLRDFDNDEVFIFFDPDHARNPCGPVTVEPDGYLQDALMMMREAEGVAFHNYMGYDWPVLEKGMGWADNRRQARARDSKHWSFFPFKHVDTYVLSTLLNPDRRLPGNAYGLGMGNIGPHSIASHGIRMGRFKPEHEDWTILDDAMIHRCVEDTAIGKDYLRWLVQEEWIDALRRKHPKTGLDITAAYSMELELGYQMARQADRGVRLDMKWCIDTFNELTEKINATEAAFRPNMPQRMCKKKKTSNDWAADVAEMRSWIAKNNPGAKWLEMPDVAHIARYSKFDRGSDLKTVWQLTTAKGDYAARVRNIYPEMVGNRNDKKDPLVVGPFSPVRYEDIPLGNRDSVKQVLFEQGWLGVNYNDTEQEYIDEHGEPEHPWSGKIDEDSIAAWKKRAAGDTGRSGRDETEAGAEANDVSIPVWCLGIAEWYILSSRRNQLLNFKDVEYYREHSKWPSKGCRGLVAQARCRELRIKATDFYARFGHWPTDPDEVWDVPAICIPIATNTFRARHKVVVNIPARGLYPLRRAFIARPGKKILGIDGAGLELRMLSHFMNDPDYEKVILSGDIHSHNQALAELPTRDQAKTWIYALLYGSGDSNLARTLGLTTGFVKAARDRFLTNLPKLAQLMAGIEGQAIKNGCLRLFDGRDVKIRRRNGELATHTGLNCLLQATGSLCMKWGLYDYLMEREDMGLEELALLIFMHDEYQAEVDECEVKSRTYKVSGESEKAAWKAEEKEAYFDELGQWSAPAKVSWNEETKELTCIRYFHEVGSRMAHHFTESGRRMGIRTPLAGEYKIGNDWHDTH